MPRAPIGFTAHNLENDLVSIELASMIEHGVPPDFIVFHQKYWKRQLLDVIKKKTSMTRQKEFEICSEIVKSSMSPI